MVKLVCLVAVVGMSFGIAGVTNAVTVNEAVSYWDFESTDPVGTDLKVAGKVIETLGTDGASNNIGGMGSANLVRASTGGLGTIPTGQKSAEFGNGCLSFGEGAAGELNLHGVRGLTAVWRMNLYLASLSRDLASYSASDAIADADWWMGYSGYSSGGAGSMAIKIRRDYDNAIASPSFSSDIWPTADIANKWVNVAMTWDGVNGLMTIYLWKEDGTLVKKVRDDSQWLKGTMVCTAGKGFRIGSSSTSQTRIDAIAIFDECLTQSQIETLSIPVTKTPIFTPDSGSYPQNVTISCETPSVTIRYTTNGAMPTTNSTVYSGVISLDYPTIIKARAWASGMLPSAVATYPLTINEAVSYWDFESADLEYTDLSVAGKVTEIMGEGGVSKNTGGMGTVQLRKVSTGGLGTIAAGMNCAEFGNGCLSFGEGANSELNLHGARGLTAVWRINLYTANLNRYLASYSASDSIAQPDWWMGYEGYSSGGAGSMAIKIRRDYDNAIASPSFSSDIWPTADIANKWVNVAMTWDGVNGLMTIYLWKEDGTLVKKVRDDSQWLKGTMVCTAGNGFRIGSSSTAQTRIDAIAIFDQCLTQSQIETLVIPDWVPLRCELGFYDNFFSNRITGIAALGATFTIMYHGGVDNDTILDWLDDADAAGLQVILEVPRVAVDNEDTTALLAYVNTMKGHDAVVGWYIYDEPENTDYDECQLAYDTIKTVSTKPVYIAFGFDNNISDTMTTFKNCFDGFGVDLYPYHHSEFEFQSPHTASFINAINTCRTIAQNLGKTWISVQQSFGKQPDHLTDWFWRLPTLLETKFMLYYAIEKECYGICYYSYYRAQLSLAELGKPYPCDGDQWLNYDVFKWFPLEMAVLHGAVNHGKLSSIVSDNISEVTTSIYVDPNTGQYYIIAINTCDQSKIPTITVNLPGITGIQKTFESGNVTSFTPGANSSTFTDLFAGYDVTVYSVIRTQ